MSWAGKPTFSVRILYALLAISIRLSKLVACPSSSKHMTTTAAPYLNTSFACCIKESSPSFKEIELTIDLPCTHFKAATTTLQSEESIINGTRAISGSEETIFKK